MTENWRDIKLCDIGMDRRFYNRIYGRLGRCILNYAKENGRKDICDRIMQESEFYYYDNITLGDIELLGFEEFVTINHVGPTTLKNFLERALVCGMEITSDKDKFFISQKLNASVNDFHKWKNAVLENAKSQLEVKPDKTRNETSLADLDKNLFVEGIDALHAYPAKYFEQDSREMKQISTAVLKYLKRYKKDIELAEDITTLEKKEKEFTAELSRYNEIVSIKQKERVAFSEKKASVETKVNSTLGVLEDKTK